MTNNDNNNTTVIKYDNQSDQSWQYIHERYNANGSLTSVVRYNDDGTRENTHYDHTNEGKSWSFYTNHFDENNKRTNTIYLIDDGRFIDYQYDVDGNANWTRRIKSYTAQGVYERTTWEYDNGLKTIRYYDRDNEHDWKTRTVNYNVDGSFRNLQDVADVENTLAEANYGEFFAATSHRFANTGGLSQLASTPRAILYADNDLNVAAGRFVEVEVEDRSFTNTKYSRPVDLAYEWQITPLRNNETDIGVDNLSNDAFAPFPLFAATVTEVETSETPLSLNHSTNDDGTQVVRKDYVDGTFSVSYDRADGVSFTDYHDSNGVRVAQKYIFADGRIRKSLYAASQSNGDANSEDRVPANAWDRLVTTYTPNGTVYRVDEYVEDGSRNTSIYDTDADENWVNYRAVYTADNELFSIDYLNDDGSRRFVTYDVAGEEEWERTVTSYNYAGQIDTITEELDNDAGSIVIYNDYADAQEWARRIVTRDADGTTTATDYIDDLDNTVAENQLRGNGDIYIAGSTTVAAGNDININASRRFGILAANNTNFGLAENSHSAFDLIGENLQLGTLYRDADAGEVGVLTDADGNPVLDEEGNTIRVEAEDATEGNLELASQTRNYSLTNTVINAGSTLSINASSTTEGVNSDIVNYGGSLIAGDNAFITSDGDIRNEVLRRNFTLGASRGSLFTRGEDGRFIFNQNTLSPSDPDYCVGRACGGEGHDYKPAEILSGGGLIIASGGSIKNYGSNIGAAGAILLSAEEDIINDAITSQYLYHYINSSSHFGLERRKEILHRAIIQEGNISSTYGSITLDAGNDIRNHASLISAGGDITLDADNDIELYAKSEEVHNYTKYRGIGFLSISQEETRYNEFGTALSQLEGSAIYASAGNNLTGIGAQLFSATDIVLDAGNNVTFDAHQNLRYRETEGWSFGISFPGSNIIAALAEGGGWEEALDAYIGSNPVLAAVHQLATADNSDQRKNGLLALGYKLPGFIARAGDNSIGAGSHGVSTKLAEGFFDELNPFRGGPLDLSPGGQAQNTANAAKGGYASFLEGVTFRFSAYESREEWTESHISRITSGQDLTIGAGNDLALVGGTVSSASRDATFVAGNDLLVSALADTNSSESSSWGASIGFGGGGVTIGGNFSESTSNGILYTNAGLTAGETLTAVSGRDMRFAGANVSATDIYLDAGRDLVVQSRQNVSTSQSSGWNFSVTVSPAGITGLSGGVNGSNSNREYTDTPTIIEAENTLDIYVEGTTLLLGAVLNSKSGDLKLDTGDFIFDNYNDVDQSESYSVGVSLNLTDLSQSDAHGSYAYSNTEAVTYATVGLGEITVRDRSDFDFAPLNRDVDNVQRVVSEENFSIEIPGINLARWIGEVEQATQVLRAASARIPEDIRIQGEQAVDLYRDAIIKGFSGAELLDYARSENFQKQLRARENYFNALRNDDPQDQLSALLADLLLGESVRIGKDGKPYIGVECGNAGPCEDLAAIEALNLEDIDSQTLIDIVQRELNNPERSKLDIAAIAYACSLILVQRDGDASAFLSLGLT